MAEILLNFFDNIILAAAVEEVVPAVGFFKDRYFPTGAGDIFKADKVITEYRDGDRKLAAFVAPRVGDIPMTRRGYEITSIQPAYIAPSRLLTLDELTKRGFGEAIYPGMDEQQRAARLLVDDMADMDARITRREEWMATQTMINNGCDMVEYIDDVTQGDTKQVRFFTGEKSDHLYTVAKKWNETGGDYRSDVRNMCRMIAIQPRKTILKLEYNDTDISGDISGDVESFTYNDRGADSSDSISIKVNAVDDKWINSWLPDKEAVLHPTLCTKNWIVQGDSTPLDCGTLVVDDLSYSAGPCVLTIGAVARPNGTSFHEKNQECVWKKTSIKRIAQTIADRYGLGCSMDAEDVDIALKEQDDTDSSFLQKLCSTYGLILKTYRSKIWIFDREQYKKKDAVATFTPADIVPNSLSWNTTLSGTYTGGEFTYSNQKKKVNIKVTIGTADRMLKLNQYASSEADAKRQLQAAIDNKNHSATTISFSTMGNLSLCSTMCINIKGLGKLNGKYYMDTVSHTLNKSSGLVTKVSASRVGG